jgi:uncharacterized protein YbjQ (UPF0145 family)
MTHQFLPDRPIDENLSRQQVEAGGLPLRAQRRLTEERAQGSALFTSTLSPAETVVAAQAGFAPVSQVMGSSMYHVGFQSTFWGYQGGELTALTQAYEHARSRALGRMRAEAQMLGAHAVVDTRFEGRGYDWADDMVEITAIGTAVRIRDQPPPREPALTLLKMDELAKLHHAGYAPIAIAMGNCFWFEPHADCMQEGSFFSSELPTHTRASLQARHLAVERFRHFAKHFNADGVVGVRVHRKSKEHEHSGHIRFHTEVMLMGTAVVRRGDAAPPPRPRLVVDVADRPRKHGSHTF